MRDDLIDAVRVGSANWMYLLASLPTALWVLRVVKRLSCRLIRIGVRDPVVLECRLKSALQGVVFLVGGTLRLAQ